MQLIYSDVNKYLGMGLHISIDSDVQKGMFNEKLPKAWSKIDNYQTYFDYQEQHRNKKTGNYPIVDEFSFFNSY